jgi:hypothetical protein
MDDEDAFQAALDLNPADTLAERFHRLRAENGRLRAELAAERERPCVHDALKTWSASVPGPLNADAEGKPS